MLCHELEISARYLDVDPHQSYDNKASIPNHIKDGTIDGYHNLHLRFGALKRPSTMRDVPNLLKRVASLSWAATLAYNG